MHALSRLSYREARIPSGPIQRRPEIVVFVRQPREPFLKARARQVWLCLLCQRHEVERMVPPQLFRPLGLALPQFSAAARPLLPVTIFCFTTVVFMRADLGVIAGLVRRPAKLIVTCLWLLFTPALLIAAALAVLGRGALDPGLLLGIAIMGAAPPIMSSPAVDRGVVYVGSMDGNLYALQ